MDLQPAAVVQPPMSPPRKLNPVIEADLYYVYHYDGTQVGCCRKLSEAIEISERDRELNDFGPELGRHCVIRGRRVAYWARRTNNGDRDTVRTDFRAKGIIDTDLDALEAKDDIRDQRPSPADQGITDIPNIEEEATTLLRGLETEIVVSFRVVTSKKSDVVTIIREIDLAMYSYSIGGGLKEFAATQIAAMKAILKKFHRRTSVEHIQSELPRSPG